MKSSKKQNMFLGMTGLAFLAYNVILFVLSGFEHEAVFWLSYVFMLLSFVSLAAVMLLLGQKGMLMRDWLFGYPLVKHSVIYICGEFILSTIFMILDSSISWEIPFVLQFLLLVVYVIFATSCFMAKQTIEEIKHNVKVKTMNIKFLRANAESLVAACDEPSLKAELKQLAEDVQYSDPMSCDELQSLEQELAKTIHSCKEKLDAKEYAEASALCREARRILAERNQKCKILKA